MACYARLAEIVALVEKFENRSLPRDAWDHTAHLTVALWYVLHYDEACATARIINGIRTYNHAHDIRQTRDGGYHETLTLFWLAVTRRFVDNAPRDASELELFNGFIEAYGRRRDLCLHFYSKKRLFSLKARQFWVEPDLRSLVDVPGNHVIT